MNGRHKLNLYGIICYLDKRTVTKGYELMSDKICAKHGLLSEDYIIHSKEGHRRCRICYDENQKKYSQSDKCKEYAHKYYIKHKAKLNARRAANLRKERDVKQGGKAMEELFKVHAFVSERLHMMENSKLNPTPWGQTISDCDIDTQDMLGLMLNYLNQELRIKRLTLKVNHNLAQTA